MDPSIQSVKMSTRRLKQSPILHDTFEVKANDGQSTSTEKDRRWHYRGHGSALCDSYPEHLEGAWHRIVSCHEQVGNGDDEV